jgi:hypothetical protein
MKNFIIVLFCFLFPLAISAKVDRSILSTDQLKVLSIKPNGSVVKVGNDKLSVGHVISASSKHIWGKGTDYMIVYNKRTNVKHRFCSREFTGNTPSLYDAYVKRNSASSKGVSEEEGIKDMKSLFKRNKVFYMIENEIYINSSVINNSSHYFELTVLSGNNNVEPLALPCNPEEPFTIAISYDILLNAGVDVKQQPVRFALTYCTPEDDIPITNDLWIEYIKP